MGFVEYSQYLCAATDMVAGMVKESWAAATDAPPHHLESLTNSAPPMDSDLGDGMPDHDLECDLEELCNKLFPGEARRLYRYVDVYCNEYCCFCQGGPSFCDDARQHIFATIGHIFRPNDEHDLQRQS